MRIKNLSTRKKEIIFLSSGILMLIIISGTLFLFSRNLTSKLERAYSSNAVNIQQEEIQFDKYNKIIKEVFPNLPPVTSASESI